MRGEIKIRMVRMASGARAIQLIRYERATRVVVKHEGLSAEEVIARLDIQTYFDLLKMPYSSTREGVLTRLISEKFIEKTSEISYLITNLGALLLAKDLRTFSSVYRKVPRVIVYKGKNKLDVIREQFGTKGYAVGYQGLISFIMNQTPENEVISRALRENIPMYPVTAIRELVANALIHQDYDEAGMPVIEIYSDRIEVINPGIPLIPTDRFVDEYKSRNEKLADILRRMGICEERSSGIDRVISETEDYQLPAPYFKVGTHHTTVILFAHQEFSAMEPTDRVRACYLHCCLKYVRNEKMTNQSLRERFKLAEIKTDAISRIIADAIKEKKIKLDDPNNSSKRYAKYIPIWA